MTTVNHTLVRLKCCLSALVICDCTRKAVVIGVDVVAETLTKTHTRTIIFTVVFYYILSIYTKLLTLLRSTT